jgi:putative hydrolase of the HAD superfamily
MIKAIFFDAAGTLIRLHKPVGETYAFFAAAHGINVAPERMNSAFIKAWKSLPSPLHEEGCPPADDDRSWWRNLVKVAFGEAIDEPLDDFIISKIFSELYEHFARPEVWGLCDGVLDTLEALSPRYRLLVLSNFDRRLHRILEGLCIRHFFSHVILSSEVGASKPHQRMFKAALDAVALPASECLHVGDDVRCDKAGAEEAGLRCFLVEKPSSTLADLARKLSNDEI